MTNDQQLQDLIKKATPIAINILKKDCGAKIKHTPTVKIHEMKGYRKDWVACYKSMSQFHYTSPTIWISADFNRISIRYDVPERKLLLAIVDSILHEYGHILCERIRFVENVNNRKFMSAGGDLKKVPVTAIPKNFNEESFAESLTNPAMRKSKTVGDLWKFWKEPWY